MKALFTFACTICLALSAQDVAAQALVVTNARILDGTGRVIENGSVVVRDGKIVSVSPGSATVPGARVIDARRKTVMPGSGCSELRGDQCVPGRQLHARPGACRLAAQHDDQRRRAWFALRRTVESARFPGRQGHSVRPDEVDNQPRYLQCAQRRCDSGDQQRLRVVDWSKLPAVGRVVATLFQDQCDV